MMLSSTQVSEANEKIDKECCGGRRCGKNYELIIFF